MSIAAFLTGFVLALSGVFPPQDVETIPSVGPTGPMRQVATDFLFTEGPAADTQGNVYFTDVRGNTIYRIDRDGNVSPFLENSEGCNGLMITRDGRLIACQGGGKRIIAIHPDSKEIDVIADSFEGQPFDRPNDLVLDRQGGIYFTDPGIGAVYYIDAERSVHRILTDLPRPNGILLSPDGRTLYVLPSGTPDVLSYVLAAPGKPGEAVVLCQLEQAPGTDARGGDGLTVDDRGVLYLTQPSLGAIQVVAPNGNTLGFIKVPENPSNCAFAGPDFNTLYITARTSVYAVPMEAKGFILAIADDPE
ncbi:SMP-30/gluconolactonase/LRE family protein [Tautonia marina]|uniref:SMP-30/gluconolactonase/LRE family protein n=1 Tax=Tautonia marina TaxID=2653855 RepID=UPI0013762A1B|nr:SMP-30/gluconolactonase/LRE family protein [Tautonia marina]